jgi:HNH endonuclease
MPAKKAPFIRFHENLTKEISPSGCWLWTGARSASGNGYGQLKVFGKMVSAHRFAYQLYRGPIDNDYHVLHSCDNKVCVNPDHLSLGTQAQNMRQAGERGLMRSGSSHPRFRIKNPRPKQANKVVVFGVEYESQKSAERALGLGSGTIRYWLKNSPNKAQLLKEKS